METEAVSDIIDCNDIFTQLIFQEVFTTETSFVCSSTFYVGVNKWTILELNKC